MICTLCHQTYASICYVLLDFLFELSCLLFTVQPDQKGVLIRRIEPTLPSCKAISEYDILLKFDGVNIANDGTVPFRCGERINFSYLVSQRYSDDEIEVTLLKKGQEVVSKVKLKVRIGTNQLFHITLCFINVFLRA